VVYNPDREEGREGRVGGRESADIFKVKELIKAKQTAVRNFYNGLQNIRELLKLTIGPTLSRVAYTTLLHADRYGWMERRSIAMLYTSYQNTNQNQQ